MVYTWDTVKKIDTDRRYEEDVELIGMPTTSPEGDTIYRKGRTFRTNMKLFTQQVICPNTVEWTNAVKHAVISDINSALFDTGSREVYVRQYPTVTRDEERGITRVRARVGFISPECSDMHEEYNNIENNT